MNNLKELREEYNAMPADVRNSQAGETLLSKIQQVIKEKKRASTPRKVLIIGGDARGTFAHKLATVMTQSACSMSPASRASLECPPVTFEVKRVGANRNLPCPCGSGKKFKKCCFNNIDPVTIEP